MRSHCFLIACVVGVVWVKRLELPAAIRISEIDSPCAKCVESTQYASAPCAIGGSDWVVLFLYTASLFENVTKLYLLLLKLFYKGAHALWNK